MPHIGIVRHCPDRLHYCTAYQVILRRRGLHLFCGVGRYASFGFLPQPLLKATPHNSRIKPIDRTTFCIFSAKLHKSPTSVACCNQIHDCLLSKNSFRIGLFDEKSDVQRAAGGAQSELCGVALNVRHGADEIRKGMESIPRNDRSPPSPLV